MTLEEYVFNICIYDILGVSCPPLSSVGDALIFAI